MVGFSALVMAVALGAPVDRTPVHQLGDLMVGRWIGDVTLIADWPNIGKRGEKIVAYMTGRWIADGQGFELDWFGADGTGKEIFLQDPDSATVRSFGTSSGGGMIRRTWVKEGDHWVVTPHGVLADGTTVRGKFKVTPEDGGRKLVYRNLEPGTVGDKKLDPLHDVYTKVSAAEPANAMLKRYGEAVVGRWTGNITLVRDWPGIGKKGDKVLRHTTWRWIAGGKALLRQTWGGIGCDISVVRWDPVKKQLCETEIGSGGTSYTAWLTEAGNKGSWTLTGSLADGTEMTGNGKFEHTPAGKQVISGEVVVGGQPVKFKDTNQRVDK